MEKVVIKFLPRSGSILKCPRFEVVILVENYFFIVSA